MPDVVAASPLVTVRSLSAGVAAQNLAMLSTDSSPIGWATLLQCREGQAVQERLLIGTLPQGSDVAEQVHREGLGVELGFTAALASKYLTGGRRRSVARRGRAGRRIQCQDATGPSGVPRPLGSNQGSGGQHRLGNDHRQIRYSVKRAPATLQQRLNSRFPEPEAEASDALAQL